jgi:hypothetical protein
MKKSLNGSGLLLAAGLAVGAATAFSPAALAWNMSGGGAWDVTNAKRLVWNPTNGGLGNMSNGGLIYSVGARPAGIQGGAADGKTAVTNSFAAWNALASSKVRINFKEGAANVKIPMTWENLAADDRPGITTNAAINFNPRAIQLHNGTVLRTDGWNLDYTGTRPADIEEIDVYTTTVHEVGHSLGLGHPSNTGRVMSPQDVSRQNVNGLFRSVEQTTPFAGQPTKFLNGGGALANGAKAYNNPRGSLTDDDAVGAITLYSAPMIDISGSNLVTTEGVECRYTITNNSAVVGGFKADYLIREATIPVDPIVPVDNLFAPAGWTITRNANDVTVTANNAAAALLPGATLDIFFIGRVYEVTNVQPSNRWRSNKFSQDGSSVAAPFTLSDWAVDNARKDYIYDGNTDKWVMRNLDLVPSPIPTPGTVVMLTGAIGLVSARRRST